MYRLDHYYGLTASELDAISELKGAFTTASDGAVILDLDETEVHEIIVNGETIYLGVLRQIAVNYVHFTA